MGWWRSETGISLPWIKIDRKRQKQLLTNFFSPLVPVSFPVLTLSTAEGQALEGDLVTLHCEAWRGSLPIQYQFFHKDVSLERSLTTSGGGASFSFSATTEHSGNYYCTANNGFGIKNSKPVSLSITGKP